MKPISPHLTEPRHSFESVVRWLSYDELARMDVIHGIVVHKPSDPDSAADGWQSAVKDVIVRRIEGRPACFVVPVQEHSNRVECVGRRRASAPLVCDALVTREPGIVIGITVADCIPLFAVNRADHVIGVAHCGWRGIASGICERFASAMSDCSEHGDQTRYLVGASIGGCCYEVRDDLLGRFGAAEVDAFSRTEGGRVLLDLKRLVWGRLLAVGVEHDNIWIDKTCTACHKYILSSYRADGNRCGRMLAFLMLKG